MDVAERCVGHRREVIEMNGVAVADLNATFAARQHGAPDIQMGGEDSQITAVVEAVEQTSREDLLHRVDPGLRIPLTTSRAPRSRPASGWRARTGAARGG